MKYDILRQIKEHRTIIIHRHVKPDPDALGSQVGLKKIIQANFPDKRVLAAGCDEPSLTWLAEMDEVADSDYEDALVIVTDTANQPRIDDQRYKRGQVLIKIDHHPNDENYGNFCLMDTTASSASELVADFAFANELALSNYAAKLLYAGILGDTGRFLYSSVSANTLEIASRLRAYDFDAAALARKMDSFPYKIAKLKGYVYDHLEVDVNGAARIIISQDILKKYDLTDAETSAIVSAPGRIEEVQAWAIFVEQAGGYYRVRMRSKFLPINQIAKEHDGGGHALASGANAYSSEEIETIYQKIKEAVAQK